MVCSSHFDWWKLPSCHEGKGNATLFVLWVCTDLHLDIVVEKALAKTFYFQINLKSAQQDYPSSRLPEFTPEDQTEVALSADFLGINHYIVHLVYPKEGSIDIVSYFEDSDTATYEDSRWYRYQ